MVLDNWSFRPARWYSWNFKTDVPRTTPERNQIYIIKWLHRSMWRGETLKQFAMLSDFDFGISCVQTGRNTNMCLEFSPAIITYWSCVKFNSIWIICFVWWLGLFSFPRSFTRPWAIIGTIICSFNWSSIVNWTEHSRWAHWTFTSSALAVILRTITITYCSTKVPTMNCADVCPFASRLRSFWKSFPFNFMLNHEILRLIWILAIKKKLKCSICRSIGSVCPP